MDKGFFSKTSVKHLLSGPLKSKFLLAVPWTVSLAPGTCLRFVRG
jgi:hypothetical protein